jgi:hypothetical protein
MSLSGISLETGALLLAMSLGTPSLDAFCGGTFCTPFSALLIHYKKNYLSFVEKWATRILPCD